ncbi:hypothetical protein CB1_000844027 [Camelus ferus]|nr:hypothetical protein CB1_000844027 [Camelus ferus]
MRSLPSTDAQTDGHACILRRRPSRVQHRRGNVRTCMESGGQRGGQPGWGQLVLSIHKQIAAQRIPAGDGGCPGCGWQVTGGLISLSRVTEAAGKWVFRASSSGCFYGDETREEMPWGQKNRPDDNTKRDGPQKVLAYHAA